MERRRETTMMMKSMLTQLLKTPLFPLPSQRRAQERGRRAPPQLRAEAVDHRAGPGRGADAVRADPFPDGRAGEYCFSLSLSS